MRNCGCSVVSISHGAAKELAAVKSGMDPKTARKYRRLGKLPSEVKIMDRDWLTRPDPFAEVWPELEAQLQLNPGLEAKTLFADLQRRFPGRFADGQLRTLQRRCRRMACSRRAGQGGLLRPGPSSRPALRQRLHALHRAWRDDQRHPVRRT